LQQHVFTGIAASWPTKGTIILCVKTRTANASGIFYEKIYNDSVLIWIEIAALLLQQFEDLLHVCLVMLHHKVYQLM